MKFFPSLLIAAVFATLTFAVWAYLNRPTREPPWPAVIQGFAFSPFRANEDPTQGQMPTDAEIDSDLALLAGHVNAVRTHSVEKTLADLEGHLDRARAVLCAPVGTAETWDVWLAYPELAQHVDFIGVHLLPYWEGVPVDQAVDYALTQFKRLQRAFPRKPIVIAEIGWPSRGRTRESAVASDANEALFLRRFLYRADKEEMVYYVMEAFDQPWKAYLEGAVGSYWGVYDVNRRPKFAFTAPIVRVPEWHILAAVSVAVALAVLGLMYLTSGTLRNRGRSFLAFVVCTSSAIAVWVFYDFTQQYMTVSSVIAGVLLLLGMLGVMLVLLAEAHEWAEAHW